MLPVEFEPRIGARRGIARHAPSRGIAKSGALDRRAHRAEAVNRCGVAAVTSDSRLADFIAILRQQRERDVDAIAGKGLRRALGPFGDNKHIFGGGTRPSSSSSCASLTR